MSTYLVALQMSASADHVVGVATPAESEDGTLRAVVGCDDLGRGAVVTVQPLLSTGQFVLHRIALAAVASDAGPEDA